MNDVSNEAQAVVNSKLNRNEFQCPQCCESFRFRRHFDKHIEGHKHNNCKHCDKLFTIRKKLIVHLLEEHGIIQQDVKYNCPFCEKVFAKKISLYQHLQIHAKGKDVCLQCGRFFTDNSEFLMHQDKHRLAKPWQCGECDEKFSRRQQYIKHVQDHGKYKCLTCNKSFSAQSKLAVHKRKGHEISELEPKYACQKCDRSFHRSRALVLHQRVHQGKSSGKHSSSFTNVVHDGSQSKQLEVDSELGFKESVKCKKKPDCTQNLSVNILDENDGAEICKTKTQDEKEPEKCIYCDYQSSIKANMKRHLEFHTEERKFICECCGASFYTLSTLNEHFVFVHSEKKNFTCPQCDKSFKIKSGLNRHLRDHTESRPFACQCGQVYKRKSHLIRHQEASHGLVSQSKKLCKLRRNESGTLVPKEEETPLKSKSKVAKSAKNKKDGVEDLTFKYAQNKEKDQLSEYDVISSHHSSLNTHIISEKVPGDEEVMKEISVDQFDMINDGVDYSQVHIPQGETIGLTEIDKSESLKMAVSQKPLMNLEMGYLLENLSSNQGNPLQNIEFILEDQVISYPSSCMDDLEQDSPEQPSVVDLVQIVPRDVLLSGENTVFWCLSSDANYGADDDTHDVPG